MNKYYALLICFSLCISSYGYAQKRVEFKIIKGIRSNYSFEIPKAFTCRDVVGKDMEFSFSGFSSMTIGSAVNSSRQFRELDLQSLVTTPSETMKTMLEEGGYENVKILKSFITILNGKKTYITYFTDGMNGKTEYAQHLVQVRNHAIVVFSLSCPIDKRGECAAYFFRIRNSIK